MLDDFIRLIEALRGSPLSLPVFALLYGAACFAAPVSLFPVAGGVLFGVLGGFTVNLATALLGASGAFFLARRFGRRRFEARLRAWSSRHAWADSLDNPGAGAFILLRLLGVPPFVVANYLAGLSLMPYGRFLWTSAVGMTPWTFLLSYFSATFWDILRRAGLAGFRQSLMEHSGPLLWGAAVFAAAMGGAYYLQRRTARGKTATR